MESDDFLKEAALATGIGVVVGVLLYVLIGAIEVMEQKKYERRCEENPKHGRRYPDYDD